MKDVVVVYKSKSGFAKQYAEWIAKELQCDLLENDKLKVDALLKYKTIIYGGGLYAIGINGIQIIKKNYEKLKNKNLIVYATGATPPREKDINKVWEENFTEEQNQYIHKFYLRGGFDYNKLDAGNKILMTMLKSKLQKEKNPDEDVMGMLMAFDKPVDFRDRDNIKPLVDYVKGLKHE